MASWHSMKNENHPKQALVPGVAPACTHVIFTLDVIFTGLQLRRAHVRVCTFHPGWFECFLKTGAYASPSKLKLAGSVPVRPRNIEKPLKVIPTYAGEAVRVPNIY